MENRLILLTFVLFGAGCASLAEPNIKICVRADKDANLEKNRSIALPTPIAFETVESRKDLDDLISMNIINKESKNKDFIYPNTNKCIKVKHARKDTMVGVFAVFNNSHDAIDKIVQRIPKGFPKKKIWINISKNKIYGDRYA